MNTRFNFLPVRRPIGWLTSLVYDPTDDFPAAWTLVRTVAAISLLALAYFYTYD